MYFDKIVESIKTHPDVIGIMLGGSRANESHDSTSDYDVYVYTSKKIEEKDRKHLIHPYVKYMEYSNEFWELEDDGILIDGTDIEFIYRSIDELDQTLTDIVFNHNAWSGYTTCFWDNLLNSKILYEKENCLTQLVSKFNIAYPKELQENIIYKNSRLLMDYMPSFYYQLDKAVKRGDLVSVNHRLTELLASYFNIVFALNKALHPGEKRLIEKTKSLSILPNDYYNVICGALESSGETLLKKVQVMIENLYDLLEQEGFTVTRSSYINGSEA